MGPFGSSGFETRCFQNCPILKLGMRNQRWRWSHTSITHPIYSCYLVFNNFTHLRCAIMGSTTSQKVKALQASLNSKKKHKKWLIALMAATAATVITSHLAPSLFPTPMNTSVLTGMAWLRELLTGHPVRFYDALAMPKHVFRKLVHELELHAGLKHSKHISAEEQVAIFLHLCKTGGTMRDLRERFQNSPDT